MKFRTWIAFVLSWLAASSGASASTSDTVGEAQRLAAFARASGYVRFFYPARSAADADWDRLLVAGAPAVRAAQDTAALRAALARVLVPIAPELRLRLTDEPETRFATLPERGFWMWQHAGVVLSASSTPGVYRQRLVQAGAKQFEDAPIFAWDGQPPGPVRAEIYPGLWLEMPLAVESGESALPSGGVDLLEQARAEKLTADDWRVRFAEVASVWTVFQHFHPYLDPHALEWRNALEPAVCEALADESVEHHYAALMRLVAISGDGHGFVSKAETAGGIPIRVVKAEGRIVVAQSTEGAPFAKGDIIRQVDGEDADAVLARRVASTPGSPHLSEFRALNQFGAGPIGQTRVEITRAGTDLTVEFTRVKDRRGYFFNQIGEFGLPAFSEVRPGIFYVNLHACDAPMLSHQWPALAQARGIIFDWRLDLSTGFAPPMAPERKPIHTHTDIIPHLIDADVQASPMRTPQIMRPDRVGWTYNESSWPIKPTLPRVRGKVVFIVEPSVVSYGETCAAILAHYHLATFVGTPTAGCNGNVNFLTLPSGPGVMWTGMEVLRHDRSPFYGVGFAPDIPVERTIAAVRDGRDEFLEKAIAVIEQAAPRSTEGAANETVAERK